MDLNIELSPVHTYGHTVSGVWAAGVAVMRLFKVSDKELVFTPSSRILTSISIYNYLMFNLL